MTDNKQSARSLAFSSLMRCERDKSYSNLEIDSSIRRNKLSDADKRLYTALVYGVIERKLTLDYIISRLSSKPLEALDADLRAMRASAVRDLLIFADRFPFLYFCEEYGLHYRAAFHGCSGDTEPSLATLKYLIDKVNDEHIPVVYTIDLSSQKVAEAVSECTGARIERLWSMQTVSRTDFDAGETYLTLMQRNYEALKGGLL